MKAVEEPLPTPATKPELQEIKYVVDLFTLWWQWASENVSRNGRSFSNATAFRGAQRYLENRREGIKVLDVEVDDLGENDFKAMLPNSVYATNQQVEACLRPVGEQMGGVGG